MTIDRDILTLLDESVLCWLATSSLGGEPNVSPKEIVRPFNNDSLIIANIASPKTARNIRDNPTACVSFVNVFTQKGFQIKGLASILSEDDESFLKAKASLTQLTHGKFPIRSVFRVMVNQVSEIVAPRYRFFPETTEQEQIASALQTYGVRRYLQESDT